MAGDIPQTQTLGAMPEAQLIQTQDADIALGRRTTAPAAPGRAPGQTASRGVGWAAAAAAVANVGLQNLNARDVRRLEAEHGIALDRANPIDAEIAMEYTLNRGRSEITRIIADTVTRAYAPDTMPENEAVGVVRDQLESWAAERAAAAATTTADEHCEAVVTIDASRAPQAAQHVRDAQAAGHPSVLTLDRPGTTERRAEALRGIPIAPGLDRDEYPPATFEEGGLGASVRHIPKSDNCSAGAQMAQQLSGLPDGCVISFGTTP